MQEHAIERLSVYRRIARQLIEEGDERVFSHDLAAFTHISPSLVRRDLMSLDVKGVPQRGYRLDELVNAIDKVLDGDSELRVGLVGVGHLGRALLSYYINRPTLRIVAAFDVDPLKVGRLVHGCRCHDVRDLENVIRELDIKLIILCVPAAHAQSVAQAVSALGVRGILNFAPVRLHLPESVQVEELDFTTSLEKLAYFSRAEPQRRSWSHENENQG